MWTYGGANLPSQNSVFYARDSRSSQVLDVNLPSSTSQIVWEAPDRIDEPATVEEFKGSWTHWVFTKNATTGVMEIYRNGALFHSETNRFATIRTITAASIGSQFNSSYYDGMIDEVQLFNVALTETEVTTLFEDSSIFGLTGEVQVATTQSETPPAVSATDLAQSEFLSSSAIGGEAVATRSAELFNGIIGNNSSDTGDNGVVRMNTDNTVTINFDTSNNTLGYDISGITSIFGWNTIAGGRSNQGYEIILTFMDGSVRTLAGPQNWEPNDPASFWTTVSFSSTTGGPMATGVKSVSFDITEPANASQAGGFLVGREFDIFGTPTASPDAEHLFTGGESLDVFIGSPTGAPGVDWDLFALDCTLVLDSSLSASNPFTVELVAGNLPTFDNTQDQSWLIVTAPQIAGIFNPDTFVVDSSDFEDDNPLNGGEFAIARIGNELFLTFTTAAAPLTALQDWRLLNFGTSENSGIAADAFDADGDGIPNLLEYATGLDPNDPSDSCVLEVGPSSTTPGDLELTFNRIADTGLTYTVEGTGDLSLATWPFSLVPPGSPAGPVIVPQSSWPASEARYFFRLRVTN